MRATHRLGVGVLAFGAVLFWRGAAISDLFAKVVVLSTALSSTVLAVAYVFDWPHFLGKTRTGRLNSWSLLVFWPYHLLSVCSLVCIRLTRAEPFHEIVPGLFLGGRLLPWERSRATPLLGAAVLDLTCELSEVRFLRRARAYRCIPLLDAAAPSEAVLRTAIALIREWLDAGPVFVHCALGHGRSATLVAGYLIATGKADSPSGAVELIRRARPGVRLNREQLRVLASLAR